MKNHTVQVLIAATALLLPSLAHAQSPAKPPKSPETLLEPKDLTEAQRTSLNSLKETFKALAFAHGLTLTLHVNKFESAQTVTNEEARDVVLSTSEPTSNPPEARFAGDIANYRLIQKYKPAITALFNRSKMYKMVGAGPVLYFGGSDLRFAQLDGKTVMVQSRATEVFLDITELDAKHRARTIIDDLVLPAVQDFDAPMKAEGIDLCAIALTYGTRDVKKQKPSDMVTETVMVAWTKADGGAFIAGQLTGDQFLKRCTVFHAERFIVAAKKLNFDDAPPAALTPPAK